jgi:hypothetical protein
MGAMKIGGVGAIGVAGSAGCAGVACSNCGAGIAPTSVPPPAFGKGSATPSCWNWRMEAWANAGEAPRTQRRLSGIQNFIARLGKIVSPAGQGSQGPAALLYWPLYGPPRTLSPVSIASSRRKLNLIKLVARFGASRRGAAARPSL